MTQAGRLRKLYTFLKGTAEITAELCNDASLEDGIYYILIFLHLYATKLDNSRHALIVCVSFGGIDRVCSSPLSE